MTNNAKTGQSVAGRSSEARVVGAGATVPQRPRRRERGAWPVVTVPESWPEYGSDAWHDLDTRDPRKKFALFVAAERWRIQQLREQQLDELSDADWYAEVFGDARRVAAELLAATNRVRSFRDAKDARAKAAPPRQMQATPGWPPIRIPGGNGRCLTYSETRTAA